MIIATTSESGTDEDTESASRVTRSMADSYLRRPSVSDRAVHTLATMANNDLSMINLEDEDPCLCDAAFVFVDHNKARFLIAGDSAAYHFVDGELEHRSDGAGADELEHRSGGEGADELGVGPRYTPHIEPVFELRRAENAFLTASPSLAAKVSDEAIGEALRESSSPEEWMDRLQELAGEHTQFCAVAAFPPMEKHSRLKSLFSRPSR